MNSRRMRLLVKMTNSFRLLKRNNLLEELLGLVPRFSPQAHEKPCHRRSRPIARTNSPCTHGPSRHGPRTRTCIHNLATMLSSCTDHCMENRDGPGMVHGIYCHGLSSWLIGFLWHWFFSLRSNDHVQSSARSNSSEWCRYDELDPIAHSISWALSDGHQ